MGEHWVKVVADFPDVEIVAFVDVDTETTRSKADAFGHKSVPVFATLAEAIEAVQADAILDSSPPFTRVAHITLAVENNLPLMIEKPLAPTMQEAYIIRDLIKDSHFPYMVAQNYRYHPWMMTIKRLIEDGKIGKIISAHVAHYRQLDLRGYFHQTLPYPLLQDMSIHHYDLMRYVLGCNPDTLIAHSWNAPQSTFNGDASVNALLEFGDIHVTYTATWSTTGFQTSWDGDWRIEGELGVIEMRNNKVGLQVPIESDERNKSFTDADVPKIKAMPTGQHHLLEEFKQAIAKKSKPMTRIQDNIYSLGMVFTAIESIQAGKTVTFDIKESS